jgi:hypothetical protein
MHKGIYNSGMSNMKSAKSTKGTGMPKKQAGKANSPKAAPAPKR